MRALALAALLVPRLAFGAIALDSTAHPTGVAIVADGAATSVTTAAFSTSGGPREVYALIGSRGDGGGAATFSVSGGGLTWSRVAYTSSYRDNWTGDIFKATASGTLTNVQITATSSRTVGMRLSVVVLSGASSTIGGVAAGSDYNNSAAQVSITATAAGSWILMAGVNETEPASVTFLANTSNLSASAYIAGSYTAMWGAKLTTSTTGAGAITVGASTVGQWGMAAVEVPMAAGSQAAQPTSSPVAGTYTSGQSVSLACSETSPTILYCTDAGGACTPNLTYSTAISLPGPGATHVRALCQASGKTDSTVLDALYTINLTVATPTFTPAAGAVSNPTTVTISTATPTATICYTTDGTDPTTNGSTCTNGTAGTSVSVTQAVTIKALAFRSGYNTSSVASASYTITAAPTSGGWNWWWRASAGITQDPPANPTAGTSYATAAQACWSDPFPATGTIYYVCDCQTGAAGGCVYGSDTNEGTSPDSPWRTFAKANSIASSAVSNVTIAFCRGGAWDLLRSGEAGSGYKFWRITNGTVRDYTPSWGTSLPEAESSLPLIAANFTTTETSPFYVSQSSNLKIENLRIVNRGSRTPSMLSGIIDAGPFWGGGPSHDVTVCGVTIDNFESGYLDYDGDQGANWVFRGCKFTNSGSFAVLASGPAFTLDSNYFDQNAWTQSDRLHAIYLQAYNGSAISGMRITNNEIYRTGGSNCLMSVITVHGQNSDLRFEGNLIDGSGTTVTDGCYGIDISNQGETGAEWCRSCIVRGNTIKNVGGTYIGWEYSPDMLVENNLLLETRSGNGGNFMSAPIKGQRAQDDVNTRNVIQNNTMACATCGKSGGIRLVSVGTGHVISSNAISYNSTPGGDSWACLISDLATSAFSVINNNLCYSSTAAGSWANDNAGTFFTLAQWRSAHSGWDTASLVVAPQFTSSSDFTPALGSPLIGAAHATQHATADIAGKIRDASPDVGAYER